MAIMMVRLVVRYPEGHPNLRMGADGQPRANLYARRRMPRWLAESIAGRLREQGAQVRIVEVLPEGHRQLRMWGAR